MENLILITYFISLCILFGFGIHGLMLLYYYRKTSAIKKPEGMTPSEFPMVTIQLPLYNECYVIERLVRSVCEIKYPQDKLEVQVLDDSTDETVHLAQSLVQDYKDKGINIKYIHRENREGYKAGALKAGLEQAEGEFIAIFDADFVPNKNFLYETIPYFKKSYYRYGSDQMGTSE